MQQAAQQYGAAQAAANPLPTGNSGDDWPTDTPCITKLSNASVKDLDAKGVDDSVSLDQAKEWASSCKALGQ